MDEEQPFEGLHDKYKTDRPKPPVGLGILTHPVRYVHFKAFLFLQYGPERYRQRDGLKQPPADSSEHTLDAIRRGCEQIFQWRGFLPDSPLEDIGVDGFYVLLRLFHFELVAQSATRAGAEMFFLDRMEMRHVVDKF